MFTGKLFYSRGVAPNAESPIHFFVMPWCNVGTYIKTHACCMVIKCLMSCVSGSVSTDEALNHRLPERHRQGRTSKDSRDDGAPNLADPAGCHHNVCVSYHS